MTEASRAAPSDLVLAADSGLALGLPWVVATAALSGLALVLGSAYGLGVAWVWGLAETLARELGWVTARMSV